MAPFCLVRQWMRLYESTEGQRLMWLCSPILEWQSFWHLSHMNDDGSCIGDALFLLFCLLVVSALALFSSRVLTRRTPPVVKHYGRLPPPPTSPRQWPFPLGPAYAHHCNGEEVGLYPEILSPSLRTVCPWGCSHLSYGRCGKASTACAAKEARTCLVYWPAVGLRD